MTKRTSLVCAWRSSGGRVTTPEKGRTKITSTHRRLFNEAARRLIRIEAEGGAGITCDDIISNLSGGLYPSEALSIRRQDNSSKLALKRRKFFVHLNINSGPKVRCLPCSCLWRTYIRNQVYTQEPITGCRVGCYCVELLQGFKPWFSAANGARSQSDPPNA